MTHERSGKRTWPTWIRHVAKCLRVMVAAVVIALLVPASTAAAQVEPPIACFCPHPDDAESRGNCPCCRHASEGGHCLPLSGTSCVQAPFVPTATSLGAVPSTLPSGELAGSDVIPLRDRLAVTRLERPPRRA